MDEFDDILGEPPQRRRPGRPRKDGTQKEEEPQKTPDGETLTNPQIEEVNAGVSVHWLSQVLKMDPKTIRGRLETGRVQPFGMRMGKPIFSLRECLPWIVVPKMQIEQALKHIRPEDLPNNLNVAYQTAKKVEQDVISGRRRNAEAAGDLWRTEAVLEVFGDVFTTIRDRMKLWADTIRDNTDMTDDQRDRLMELVDALQHEIHEKLVELPRKRKHGSLLTETLEGTPDAELV
jgi:hypothetical protein